MTGSSGWQRTVITVLLGLGVVLRLRAYLANRSLWLDESYLVLNLLERDFAGLVGNLDYKQAAPVGFLFAQRLIVNLFGSSEYALRALPFLAGICAVFLFWWLASRVLPPAGTMIAVAIFAISEPLIRYAAEFKQYGVDVAIALLLWWTFTRCGTRLDADRRDAWALVAVLGGAAIWVSHPAIFVVAGFAIHSVWEALRLGAWKSVAVRASVSFVWVGSFVAVYFVSLRYVNPLMYTSWRGAEAALVPVSAQDFGQHIHLTWTLGVLPLGPRVVQLATLCAILGVVALWRRRCRQGAWFAGTFAVVLVASSLGKYPITPRLWLFLTPVIVLLAAAGVDEVWQRTRLTFRPLAPILACLLFILPAAAAARDAIRPPGHEETRPLLAYMQARYRHGDVLYLYTSARPAARYYASRGLHFPGEIVMGRPRGDWDVEQLRGRERVWFLFSHVRKRGGMDDEKLLVHSLDRAGVRLDIRRETGASLYLYDLSRTP